MDGCPSELTSPAPAGACEVHRLPGSSDMWVIREDNQTWIAKEGPGGLGLEEFWLVDEKGKNGQGNKGDRGKRGGTKGKKGKTTRGKRGGTKVKKRKKGKASSQDIKGKASSQEVVEDGDATSVNGSMGKGKGQQRVSARGVNFVVNPNASESGGCTVMPVMLG